MHAPLEVANVVRFEAPAEVLPAKEQGPPEKTVTGLVIATLAGEEEVLVVVEGERTVPTVAAAEVVPPLLASPTTARRQSPDVAEQLAM